MMRTSHSALALAALLACVCLLSTPAAAASSSNLIVNGGFEQGRSTPPYNITDWNVVPGWTLVTGLTSPYAPPPYNNTPTSSVEPGCIAHTGAYAADLGAEVYPDNLTQTVATTPKTTYTLSFWLWNQATYGDVQHNADGEPIFIKSTTNRSAAACTNTYFNVQINNVSITGLKPLTKTYNIPFAVLPYTKAAIPAGTKFKTVKFPTIPFSNADSFTWVQYKYSFTATSIKTTLTFQGTNCGAHFSLDDIVLSADSHQ